MIHRKHVSAPKRSKSRAYLSKSPAYLAESRALDEELLQVIRSWHETGRELSDAEFNDLALRIFAHQLRYNKPYAQFCALRGVTESTLPESWEKIPAVPAAAYKEAALTTFDPKDAALTFETSGTTQGVSGKHYMETSALYDAGLLATFDRLVLRPFGIPAQPLESVPQFRHFNLLQAPARHLQSSLSYMVGQIYDKRSDGVGDWVVTEGIQLSAFMTGIEDAQDTLTRDDEDEDDEQRDPFPVFIAGTAFSFLEVCNMLAERDASPLWLPPGSIIMETGGFKGRSALLSREELYAMIAETFRVPQSRIFSEYGMTELTSQYYDDIFSILRDALLRADPLDDEDFPWNDTDFSEGDKGERVKKNPPWLRARVTGLDGNILPKGMVGALAHVDLLNRSSCIAIQTEDVGAQVDGGIILLGREEGAPLRGCSLDAEGLRAL